MTPPMRKRTRRAGAGDMTRRASDFATLGEVGAIANEALMRMREYVDGELESLVRYQEERKPLNRLKAKIRSWRPSKNSKPE